MKEKEILETINGLYPQLGGATSSSKIDGGIENNVLRLRTKGRSHIARIHNKRNRRDVSEEVGLLCRTRFSPFSVPDIILNTHGSYVSTINGKPLTIYPEIDGVHTQQVTSGLISDMKAFIRLLHVGGQQVSTSGPTLDNTIRMASELISCGLDNADEINAEVSTFETVSELLSLTPRVAIHSDLGPANILVDQASRLVGVIDFDDIYIDHSILDLTGFMRGYAFVNKSRYDPAIGTHIWSFFSESFSKYSYDDLMLILRFTCFRFYIFILWSDIFLRSRDLLTLAAAGFNNDYARWRSLKL